MTEDPEQVKRRAREAKQLLDHPLLKAAFTEMRDECVRELTDSKLDDDDTRRMARHKLEGVRIVLLSLHRHLETGRLVSEGEENEEELDSFLRQYGL